MRVAHILLIIGAQVHILRARAVRCTSECWNVIVLLSLPRSWERFCHICMTIICRAHIHCYQQEMFKALLGLRSRTKVHPNNNDLNSSLNGCVTMTSRPISGVCCCDQDIFQPLINLAWNLYKTLPYIRKVAIHHTAYVTSGVLTLHKSVCYNEKGEL